MTTIINCTPHEIVVVVGDKETRIPASGIIPRVTTTEKIINTLEIEGVEVPVTKSVAGKTEGLPAKINGTYYIVSRVVASSHPDRNDLLIPNGLVRDQDGRIVGCSSLVTISLKE